MNGGGKTDAELELLSALVDGELSEREREAVLERLAGDAGMETRMWHYHAQKRALKALFPMPEAAPLLFVQRRTPWRRLGAAIVCALLLGIALGWGGARDVFGLERPEFAAYADQAYAVYSPGAGAPPDMAADNAPRLQAWLAGHLGRALPLPSLREYGYALTGARLLPGEEGPAVQLMYQNPRGQRAALYIAGYQGGNMKVQALRRDGRRTWYWADKGAGFAFSGLSSEPKLQDMAWELCSDLGGNPDGWKAAS